MVRARDFGANQAAEIPEYFVYFGIFAVQSWGKRSALTAKRFFWGRTIEKARTTSSQCGLCVLTSGQNAC